MQIGTTFNYLVWSSDKRLPFPEQTESLTAGIDLSSHVWNATGLPVTGALYSVSGNQLYFEETPEGKTELKREEFTGEFIFGGVLLNKDQEGPSFFLSFRATVLKGDIVEVLLEASQNIETKEYYQNIESLTKKMVQTIKRRRTWWYRWLYWPYMVVVRYVAIFLCWILVILKEIVSRIALFLTPI